MNLKKKLLDKCLKKLKEKQLPKQLSIIILAISLIGIYFIDFIYRVFSKVCSGRKVIISSVLITIITFLTVTYFFYNGLFPNPVFADTISETKGSVNSVSAEEGTYLDNSVSTEEETYRDSNDVDSADQVEYLDNTQIADNETTLASATGTSDLNLNPYYIKVNRQQNCVTIYTYDKSGNYTVPVKAMIASTGGERTPLGTFKISSKYEFKDLLYNVYGQYAVRIVGQILFHSSSYSKLEKDTLIAEEYNRLGESVSHGCIRLTAKDAKWIFDNCVSGTVVEIYDDETSPGPLGKPLSIHVPEGTKWDPTDPDPNNPWNNKSPWFEGVKNKKVKLGSSVDLIDGIKAFDTCGNEITKEIKISGEVNTDNYGTYTVKYYVTDLLGRMTIATATYTVK